MIILRNNKTIKCTCPYVHLCIRVHRLLFLKKINLIVVNCNKPIDTWYIATYVQIFAYLRFTNFCNAFSSLIFTYLFYLQVPLYTFCSDWDLKKKVVCEHTSQLWLHIFYLFGEFLFYMITIINVYWYLFNSKSLYFLYLFIFFEYWIFKLFHC